MVREKAGTERGGGRWWPGDVSTEAGQETGGPGKVRPGLSS